MIATPRADQQIAGLDRTDARAFGEFLDDLAARGCQALGYRLSGPAPVDHLCARHLRDSLRVVVAFEGQRRAWILLVGRHDDQDPVRNVYAELCRLLGVEPPDSAGRDKPPCCDQNTDLPPVLGAAVTELVERAAKVCRTRHQAASLPACVAPSSSGTDRNSRSSLLAAGSIWPSRWPLRASEPHLAAACTVRSNTSTESRNVTPYVKCAHAYRRSALLQPPQQLSATARRTC